MSQGLQREQEECHQCPTCGTLHRQEPGLVLTIPVVDDTRWTLTHLGSHWCPKWALVRKSNAY
jgi:hypothetical protein